jgi:uncharacterized protein YjdB
VVAARFADVRVYPVRMTLVVGATAQLRTDVRARDGALATEAPVTWQSSDPTVATVSPSGRIVARAAGTITVTALVEGRAASAIVTVTVPKISASGPPAATEGPGA